MDNFKILLPIGSGSYGTVYKAQDKKTNEIVALKQIHKVSSSSNIIDKFYYYRIVFVCRCKFLNIFDFSEWLFEKRVKSFP